MAQKSDYYKKLGGSNKNGIYYIHLHSKNIGRAANKGKGKYVQIAKRYTSNRGRIGRQAINKAKKEYMERINGRISSNGIRGIEELFSSEDDFTYFDKELRKSLQDNLNTENIANLIVEGKEIVKTPILRGKTQIYIEEYNKLIESFQKMADQIANNGEYLAIALQNSKLDGKGYVKTSTAGKKLNEALQKLKKEIDGEFIYPQDIAAAAQQIEYFSNTLNRGKFNSGGSLTKTGIKKICQNIISAGFAESFAMDITNDAIINLDKVTKTAVGTNGTYVPQEDGTEKWVSQGKEDVHLKNIQVTIDKHNRTYNVDIGLSVKAYLNNLVFGTGSKKRKTNKISSGSGGTLGSLIKRTFLSQDRYIVYNAFCFEDRGILNPIQAIILARNINLFFSGRTSEDFNTFIVANGEVISLWELIQQIADSGDIYNYIGNSNSKADAKQPIALSVGDRKKIFKANKRVEPHSKNNPIELAWARSKNVNNVINNAKVTAHINTLALSKKL